jgi:hypothetical protein
VAPQKLTHVRAATGRSSPSRRPTAWSTGRFRLRCNLPRR